MAVPSAEGESHHHSVVQGPSLPHQPIEHPGYHHPADLRRYLDLRESSATAGTPNITQLGDGPPLPRPTPERAKKTEQPVISNLAIPCSAPSDGGVLRLVALDSACCRTELATTTKRCRETTTMDKFPFPPSRQFLIIDTKNNETTKPVTERSEQRCTNENGQQQGGERMKGGLMPFQAITGVSVLQHRAHEQIQKRLRTISKQQHRSERGEPGAARQGYRIYRKMTSGSLSGPRIALVVITHGTTVFHCTTNAKEVSKQAATSRGHIRKEVRTDAEGDGGGDHLGNDRRENAELGRPSGIHASHCHAKWFT